MKLFVILTLVMMCFTCLHADEMNMADTKKFNDEKAATVSAGHFETVWEKSYGKLWWWSARYEGPQPVGDADNDGQNELLIGGRDPFMRVMKYNGNTYVEQARIIDPVLGIGYTLLGFGSATGFSIADIDNDGENEIGVAWGHHFSAFKWNGFQYKLMGQYTIEDERGTTLDCIVGDCDNDGVNEVVVTGGYGSAASVVALVWDGNHFVKEAEWGRDSVYFPWIEDVDDDGANELLVGHGQELVILQWDGEQFIPTIVADYRSQVFGCVAKDSDGDGNPEIHVTFYSPDLKIYGYENGTYREKASFKWNSEEDTIEAIDVGDVDNDGVAEVCVGTDKVHILQWNGHEYVEDYVINETYGLLAVTCVGDMDNDDKLEINAGAVGVSEEQDYRSWIFKYVE